MKGALKAIGVFITLMAIGNVFAEEQNPPIASGTTIVVAQQIALPIPIPGGGTIGTTANWDGNTKPPVPCELC